MESHVWQSIPQLENRDGELFFDGMSVTALAKEFGTPLYLYSENRIRENYRRLLNAYRKYYPNFALYYAVKANNHPVIVQILAEEGAGADCCNLSEIQIAEMAGIPLERCSLTGCYISSEEFQELPTDDLVINIENVNLLNHLKNPKRVSFRINPNITNSGEEGLRFAGEDAKFGIPCANAEEAYRKALEMGATSFGVHMMTGSNILDVSYFAKSIAVLLDIIGPIAQKLGITFDFINIGGSLGIPYRPEQDPLPIEEVARSVTDTLKSKLEEYQMPPPQLIMEPGRYLVGDAGILLTRVTSIKREQKTFIGIDAGMHTLLRPMLYGSYHHILHANDLSKRNEQPVTIVGPVCENTDQFAKDRLLPNGIKEGDALAILDVGAYGFGMSSQYNTFPRAAEVLLCSGNAEIIRKRETFYDLLKNIKTVRRTHV